MTPKERLDTLVGAVMEAWDATSGRVIEGYSRQWAIEYGGAPGETVQAHAADSVAAQREDYEKLVRARLDTALTSWLSEIELDREKLWTAAQDALRADTRDEHDPSRPL